ncbi:hypothetical protein [Archangium sp.]|uniref:hypothetical protein n=1 Tax=Archangium sp. TaxID=1872627 RepID=UPI002D372647|nr:hypothetical protein [Archangium sp.]HYO51637.1 hypothetical protein [Archangium sp.]
MFARMWCELEVTDEFVCRLLDYTAVEGSILVNACTSGAFKQREDRLWRQVEDGIQEIRKRPSDLILWHPSAWHWSTNPRAV